MDYAWLLFLKVNEPPQVDAGKYEPITSNSIQLIPTVTDDPGDTLAYHWVQDSGPGTADFDDEFSKETLVTFTASGIYTLIFTADDGEFESSDTVVITVTNTPPNVNAGADQQITHPTNSVSLSGSVSDVENNVEGIAWSQVSGPGGVSFSNPSAVNTNVTFYPGEVGEYELRLTASDWEFTQSDTVIIDYLSQPVPKIDVVVAIGDSITVGFGDLPSCQPNPPGTPLEQIDKACNGYTVPLTGRLSGANGYASTVYVRERGTSGVTSGYGVNHIQQILGDHPAADQYLVMYGTNDANLSTPTTKSQYRSNIQTIIQAIKGKNMQPVLAYIPFGKNQPAVFDDVIRIYNGEIWSLASNMRQGPALYAHFRDHQNQLNTNNVITGAPDGLHPTHTGYSEMARLWAAALIQ